MKKAEALLILLSPFFFWGTSMVAMKVGLASVFNPQSSACTVNALTNHSNEANEAWSRHSLPTQLPSL